MDLKDGQGGGLISRYTNFFSLFAKRKECL